MVKIKLSGIFHALALSGACFFCSQSGFGQNQQFRFSKFELKFMPTLAQKPGITADSGKAVLNGFHPLGFELGFSYKSAITSSLYLRVSQNFGLSAFAWEYVFNADDYPEFALNYLEHYRITNRLYKYRSNDILLGCFIPLNMEALNLVLEAGFALKRYQRWYHNTTVHIYTDQNQDGRDDEIFWLTLRPRNEFRWYPNYLLKLGIQYNNERHRSVFGANLVLDYAPDVPISGTYVLWRDSNSPSYGKYDMRTSYLGIELTFGLKSKHMHELKERNRRIDVSSE